MSYGQPPRFIQACVTAIDDIAALVLDRVELRWSAAFRATPSAVALLEGSDMTASIRRDRNRLKLTLDKSALSQGASPEA